MVRLGCWNIYIAQMQLPLPLSQGASLMRNLGKEESEACSSATVRATNDVIKLHKTWWKIVSLVFHVIEWRLRLFPRRYAFSFFLNEAYQRVWQSSLECKLHFVGRLVGVCRSCCDSVQFEMQFSVELVDFFFFKHFLFRDYMSEWVCERLACFRNGMVVWRWLFLFLCQLLHNT